MDGQMRTRRYQEIVRLSHAGHDLPTLFRETARALRQAIPFEAACWHTLDPATLLETSYEVVNLPLENPRAAEIEYLHEDYNQFAVLARGPRRSGILSVATGGVPERSLRYRELIRPLGLEGELRAAFVADGSGWGSVCLLRERASGGFTAEDVSFLDGISACLARAIRVALLLRAATAEEDGDGPGLVLLDERQRLAAITPAAERLLAELTDAPGEIASGTLPYVVHAVAARARLAGRSDGAEVPARARVRTRSGRWLDLHGSLTAGELRRVAVIVERTRPVGLAPLIAEAYGLTGRERDVMQQLLQGRSTKEIAAALRISPYTVQEHFNAIFDKVGVRSRRELVGRVFYRHYLPRMRQGVGIGPSGSFAVTGAARSAAPSLRSPDEP